MRCPNYRPGDLYKCELQEGHEGPHQARLLRSTGEAGQAAAGKEKVLRWTTDWQPAETKLYPEIGVVEAETSETTVGDVIDFLNSDPKEAA